MGSWCRDFSHVWVLRRNGHRYCKTCRNSKNRVYDRTRSEAGLRLDMMNRSRIHRIKLERGCIDCGYRKHAEALTFDHTRGEKRCDVSQMMSRRWEHVLEEIAKCDVRCANCHAVKTAERRNLKDVING